MQDVTPWPESFDVSKPVARVIVDGTEMDVKSVSVTSELDSAMPERVAAGGGAVVAATGDATVLRPDDVTDAGFNPWGDARGLVDAAEVVVEAGFRDPATGGVGCARQITGQVSSLSGGALSQSVDLDFVDFATALDRDITIEPLMQLYPNRYDGEPLIGAGLSTLYVTNRIVRHCGFYSTPPLVSGAMVSAPLFGSGVAERGTLVAGRASSGSPNSAAFWGTRWGLGFADGVLEYLPNYGGRGHGRLTATLHASFLRATPPDSGGQTARITAQWGSASDAVHVYVHASGAVSVRYRDGGTVTVIAEMGPAVLGDSEMFTVSVTPSGEAMIFASNGASVTGQGSLPSRVTGSNMDRVVIDVPDGAPILGGVQVGFSTTRNHTFEPTAHFPSAIYRAILALPAHINQNCMNLLKDQSEAELSAMWIDEFGHFWWLDRHQLAGSAPRGTLTSLDDLLDLQWSLPARSVFSRVVVEHSAPRITRRTVASVTVADSRGSRLSNTDTETEFYEPAGDEDWHFVDIPQWLGGNIGVGELKRGRGSYRGGVVVNDDDDDERMAYSSNLVQIWEQVHPQKWLLTSTAQGLLDTEFIEQRFLDDPARYGSFAGESVPLIRARGKVQWEPHTTIGGARGPSSAPELTHSVGPWIQNLGNLQDLADFLAEELTEPSVILRDVPLIPDPRIQLGDTFWLVDRSAYDIRLRVVVMGKTLTYETTGDGVRMSQRVTFKVVSAERLKVTYQEFENAWAPLSYTDLRAAWATQDYAALEADPLDRRPPS